MSREAQQRRACEEKSCKEWLRTWGLSSLDKERLSGDLTALHSFPRKGCGKRRIEPCSLGPSDRIHGNGSRLLQARFRLDSRKCFITKGGVTHSNRLSREVVDASTPDSV